MAIHFDGNGYIMDELTAAAMPFWKACEYPERPPDEWMSFHLRPRCQGCVLAATGLKANFERFGLPEIARKQVELVISGSY